MNAWVIVVVVIVEWVEDDVLGDLDRISVIVGVALIKGIRLS